MTTSIAIILVALATTGNSVAIFFSERRYQQSKNGFLSDIPITQREARILNDEINKIKNRMKDEVKYVRPLIDKHKKEQKQKHWKQYNDWKRMYESKHGRCAQCHSDNLEINTEYKYDRTRPAVFIENCIDYPKSAEYKCNTCGEVISKWEFKEDNE